MGGPEFSLLRIATTEMGRYYNLPFRGGGMIADAKMTDAQMGAEWMLREFDVNHASIALNIRAEVGPGGNYLAEDHTAKDFRDEFWFPKI